MTQAAGPEILVIDDEAGIVEMLSIVFGKEGYRVGTARSCAEGLTMTTAYSLKSRRFCGWVSPKE